MTNVQLQQEASFDKYYFMIKTRGCISAGHAKNICYVLNCDGDDILEFIPENNGGKENG